MQHAVHLQHEKIWDVALPMHRATTSYSWKCWRQQGVCESGWGCFRPAKPISTV